MSSPRSWMGWPAAAAALAICVAVQLLVGTRGGPTPGLRLSETYHQDFWYYAGLARALTAHFPPMNPTFAGEPLSQHSYHLLPLTLLSAVTSPYLAMRVLNVVYLGGLLLLLRRYFPREFGLVGLCLVIAAPAVYHENPLGMDLLTRGFHHLPFLFLLCAALFERNRRIRAAALFLLPWVHGVLTVAFAPAVAWSLRGERRFVALAGAVGFATAAAAVLAVSGGRSHEALLRFRFEPLEPIRHLVPLGVALAAVRVPIAIAAAAGGLLLGSTVLWMRYYFLFPIDFACALAAARGVALGRRTSPWIAGVACALSAAFFARGMLAQFGPHRPFDDRAVAPALAWIERHTPPDAVFLVAPTPREFETDSSYYEELGYGYWLAAQRDLYVGFFGWAEVVGLPGVARSLDAHAFYCGTGPVPKGVDYVLVGPMERGMYPQWRPPAGLTCVFQDQRVAVFQVAARFGDSREARGPLETH